RSGPPRRRPGRRWRRCPRDGERLEEGGHRGLGARVGRRRRRRHEPDRLGRRAILASPRATILVVVWVSLAVANGPYFSFSGVLPPLPEEFRWSLPLTSAALALLTVVQPSLAPVASLPVAP